MARGKRSRSGFGLIRAFNMLAFLPLARRAPLYGRLLWALASDPRVPASRKALLGLAAAYLVSPIDLVPEFVPILGALDDVAVVVLAVDLFLEGLPAALVGEKLDELGIPREELDSDLQRVRRLVPRPVRRAVARIPDVIDGAADFARDHGLEQRLRDVVGGSAARGPTDARGAAARSADNNEELEVRPA